jgi:hypothetical protein
MTTLIKYVLMASMTVFLLSCALGGGKPAMMLEQYALEYPPPSLQDLNRIDEVIRVDAFQLPRSSTMPRLSTGKNPTITMTTPTIAGVPILGIWSATTS